MKPDPNRNWSIRRAKIDDAEALTAIMHSAYGEYSARFDDEILPPLSVDYAQEIQSFPVWVAESCGSLVGGIMCFTEDDQFTIANVAVSPQFQGQGLGRGLLEFAEAEARNQGELELHLATHVKLVENIALYKHLGWAERGRDERRVFMRKTIFGEIAEIS